MPFGRHGADALSRRTSNSEFPNSKQQLDQVSMAEAWLENCLNVSENNFVWLVSVDKYVSRSGFTLKGLPSSWTLFSSTVCTIFALFSFNDHIRAGSSIVPTPGKKLAFLGFGRNSRATTWLSLLKSAPHSVYIPSLSDIIVDESTSVVFNLACPFQAFWKCEWLTWYYGVRMSPTIDWLLF